jgi:hypothetical protein
MFESLIRDGYLQGLGRAPGPLEWKGWTEGANNPAQVVNGFFRSPEYKNLSSHLSNSAKITTLYRVALKREGDSLGKESWENYLNATNDFDGVINGFIQSAEFQCRDFSENGFNVYGVLPSAKVTMTGDELQALLDTNIRVTLSNEVLVELSKPLIIRTGETLRSDATFYASMPRLSRVNGFDDALVKVEGGAHLENIWVSGNRNSFVKTSNGENLLLEPGTGPFFSFEPERSSSIVGCRLDTTNGFTNLLVSKENRASFGPEKSYILNNFITGSESTYRNTELNYCDGITNTGKSTVITGNTIVDTTDGGIVNFSYLNYINNKGYLLANASQVTENRIIALTNSSYGAIITDPFYVTNHSTYGDPANKASQSFLGLLVANNSIWTSDLAHYNVVLSVGTRLWFGEYGFNASSGGTYVNNNSAGGTINCYFGEIVSGVLFGYLNNSFTYTPMVKVALGMAKSAGYGSADLAGRSYVDADFFSQLLEYN